MKVHLARRALESIRGEAARAYPEEACGALIGSSQAEVMEALALPNHELTSPRSRFAISPGDYLRAETAAELRGRQLVGFWHSHPDHAARPSPSDREHAWEGLLTVVVAVEKGHPREITAWTVPGLGRPFAEVPLAVEEA
jgi:proteasome lid subunit RPN8/RPN11